MAEGSGGDGDTITITLPGAGKSSAAGDTAATLVLSAGNDDDGSGLPDKLTLTTGTSENLYVSSGSMLDLFDSSDFEGTRLGTSQVFAEVTAE